MTYLSVLPFDNPAQAPPAWQAVFLGRIAENPSTGCWEWTRSRAKGSGYGRVYWNGQTEYAHRVSLTLGYRPLSEGEQALHHCDNPPCVRHLYPGNQSHNARDREQRGRGYHGAGPCPQTHCTRGHALTPDNVYRNGPSDRMCRTCHLARQRRYYAQRKGAGR